MPEALSIVHSENIDRTENACRVHADGVACTDSAPSVYGGEGLNGFDRFLDTWAIPKMKNMMAWPSGPRIRCRSVSR